MPAHLVHMKVENVTHAYCGAKDPGPAHVKHALLFFLKRFIISSHFSIWSCLLVNDETFSLSHFMIVVVESILVVVVLVPPPGRTKKLLFFIFISSSSFSSSSRHKTARRQQSVIERVKRESKSNIHGWSF